jgi:hypothetical protein
MEGYFKVHRKILNSQVFAHQTSLKIWVWCMAKVTFKERFVPLKIGKGETTVKLLPGQFIFGRFKAEEELGIDGSTIYKWIQKFASPDFDMITVQSNNQYSIITLCNWEQYNSIDEEEITTKEQPSNSGVTTVEQPSNNSVTQTIKINNDKKDNNVKNPESGKPMDFIDRIISEFVCAHGDYEVMNRGKERQAAGKILKLYKSKYPNADSEEVLSGLRNYFNQCVDIPDPWLHDRMSLSIIESKFNEINKILKNGKSTNIKGGTDRAFFETISKHLTTE